MNNTVLILVILIVILIIGIFAFILISQKKEVEQQKQGGNLLATLAPLIPLIASDRALKENIKTIGEFAGLPFYSYNYKGDKENRIGVMAQDVEKVYPNAIRVINGNKFIDFKNIL